MVREDRAADLLNQELVKRFGAAFGERFGKVPFAAFATNEILLARR